MGLLDFLFESDVESEALPSVSQSQQALIDALSEWLEPKIGKGAEPYTGKLAADIPDLFMKAYKDYEAGFGGAAVSQAIQDLISGKPAYTFKPGEVSERWQETYAGPVMEAYRENVLPFVRESFNIPGVLYSRAGAEGVSREAGKFYGQYVAPTLYSSLQAGEQMGFQSAEAAAGRRMPALDLPAAQFGQAAGVATTYQQLQQQQLSAAYQEFLRTRAEPGWPAQTAMGFMTQPTVDWAAFRESSIIEQLSMLAAGGGALAEGAAAFKK